jgi:hypothetical protein
MSNCLQELDKNLDIVQVAPLTVTSNNFQSKAAYVNY